MSPSALGALRLERKASSLPSGLQRGLEALKAELDRRVAGAEPSEGLIQSSVWRWFSDSTMAERVKTTQRPSGEMAGVAAVWTRDGRRWQQANGYRCPGWSKLIEL